MPQVSKAEQLRLPEQMYILLVNPDTGEPRFDRQRVEAAMSMSMVWELLHAGAFETGGDTVNGVQQALFEESYLRRSALMASRRVPVEGRELVWDIAAELHPIWKAIGEDMIAKHLVTEEVQTRFVFFHHRVLSELAEARGDESELSTELAQAARNLWDPNYDAELARTHPRLLARLVLLDNHRLLEPLIGPVAYAAALPHMADIRAHLHEMVQNAQTPRPPAPSRTDTTRGCGDSYIYDSGSSFWIDSGSYDSGGYGYHHEGHGHHGHDGHCDHDGNDGSDGDSGCDCGGDGGGGDCGGCGGCGG